MRFEGQMNVDINEIATNMIPFHRLKFLIPSASPQSYASSKKVEDKINMRLDMLISQCIDPNNRLVSMQTGSAYRSYSCAFLFRGEINLQDIRKGVGYFKTKIKFPWWNKNAFKVGHCAVPGLQQVIPYFNI